MRIGIDLGGSKIEIIVLDRLGIERYRQRIPAPRGDYDATMRAIRDLVAAAESALDQRGSVGIGIPGAISPATGHVKNANSTWLIGKPFDRDVARALDRPVRVANDADCFALSEATDGGGQGADPVFGVILGTGVGGGIVVGGKLVRGPNAIAGEWGHNPLPWPDDGERPGPPCYCGRSGCIETFLSGPGLVRDYARGSDDGDLSAMAISERADRGDPAARSTLERYGGRLARALAVVINILDPEVIVLGGGLSNIAAIYDRVPRLWETYIFSDHVATRLVPARHGDSSGVRGAAWLWPAEMGDESILP